MGRPDADLSAYKSHQIQTECEPNHGATPTYPNNQVGQQYQPQPQQPPPRQYPPPQPNQAYPTAQPSPYPPQNLQNNPVYPPQPVQYPPRSPPTNQMYSNVSPQVKQSQTEAPNVSAQAFPQPSYLPPAQGIPSASPHKPGGHPPAPVSGIPVEPGGDEGWRSGLFDFMDDPMNALVTAFLPCLTFGQIAEIVDDGHTTCGTSGLLYGAIGFLIGMPCLISCTYRTKLRNKFGLPEAPAPDWVTHFLCECCALCQEYRELQHRGWDPSIGWQGNLARNQMQQPVMMSPMNQRMMA